MAEDMTRLLLRLPTPMRDALAEMARAERRSLNGQILYLLQRALDERTNAPPAP